MVRRFLITIRRNRPERTTAAVVGADQVKE
jgi:hypothetical protein